MPKIIEFIGPRGVGKSTLYKKVLSLNRNEKKFRGKDDFIPTIEKVNSTIRGYFEYQLRKFLNKPKKDYLELKKLGYEFLKNHPEFIDFSWQMVNKYQKEDHNGIDNRIRICSNLINYYTFYQAISNSNLLTKYCLTDESLIHTSLFLFNNVNERKDIVEFISIVPAPAAVIYCKADPDTISSRSKTRELVLSQIDKNEIQLKSSAIIEIEICNILTNNLKLHGVKVLEIDTGDNIEENSKLITDFILSF
jgi:hypothetical protein